MQILCSFQNPRIFKPLSSHVQNWWREIKDSQLSSAQLTEHLSIQMFYVYFQNYKSKFKSTLFINLIKGLVASDASVSLHYISFFNISNFLIDVKYFISQSFMLKLRFVSVLNDGITANEYLIAYVDVHHSN